MSLCELLTPRLKMRIRGWNVLSLLLATFLQSNLAIAQGEVLELEAYQLVATGDRHYQQGQFQEAAQAFEKALQHFNRRLGPDHRNTLGAADLLIASYMRLGRYGEALKMLDDMVIRERARLGADHPDTVSAVARQAIARRLFIAQRDASQQQATTSTGGALFEQGVQSYQAGKFADATSKFEQAYQEYARQHGPEHPLALTARHNVAGAYLSLGRVSEAAKVEEEVLAIRRRVHGAEHPETLAAMNSLGGIYSSLGRGREAAEILESLLAIQRQQVAPNDRVLFGPLMNLASAYSLLGRHADALKLREDTLPHIRNKLGPEHPNTLLGMQHLARSYKSLGRSSDALKLQEETLARMRAALGPDHPDTGVSMNDLADSYKELGRFALAAALEKATLNLRRRTLGESHPLTIESIGRVAGTFRDLGRTNEAATMLEELLNYLRRVQGPESRVTLQAMQNLAAVYQEIGRTADALRLQEETIDVQQRTLGSDHIDSILGMNNLANSYGLLGRRDEALRLHQLAWTSARDKLGADHPDTLVIAGALADDYLLVGRGKEAVELRKEVVELSRKVNGPLHMLTVKAMNKFAASLFFLSQDAAGVELLAKGLEITRTVFGNDHPETVFAMNSLAGAYLTQSRYAETVRLHEESLLIRRKLFGEEHAATLNGIGNLASVYFAVDRKNESRALRREALAIVDRSANTLMRLSREERGLALAGEQRHYIEFARELSKDPAAFDELFNVVERGKARALLEELTARRAIQNSGLPPAMASRLATMRGNIEGLDALISTAVSDDAKATARRDRDRIKVELDALNSKLAAEHPRYAALSNVRTVSLSQGRSLMPSKSVFISWMLETTGRGIVIAIGSQGGNTAKDFELGNSLAIHASSFRWLVALPTRQEFAAALQSSDVAAWMEDDVIVMADMEHKPAGARLVQPNQYSALRAAGIAAHGAWLANALLRPVMEHASEADQWILSPDGVLATLPWDLLPINGKPLGLIKQVSLIQSLSVYKLLKDRREEYAQPEQKAKRKALLAIGGAIYDAATSGSSCARGRDRDRDRDRDQFATNNLDITSTVAKQDVRRDRTLATVQASEAYREMLALRPTNLPCSLEEVEQLSAMFGGEKLVSGDATESKLREMSDSGRLAEFRNLHFATHGILNTTFPSLSAVLLGRTGNQDANDGFITAAEWTSFRLESDLLVMSACETGLGRIVNGDGVQGLPYALYVAGNRDTVLTLWKIDDEGTSLFMQRFWSKIKDGESHAQALAQTKREMMEGQAGGQFSDPFYWAPFVLYGLHAN